MKRILIVLAVSLFAVHAVAQKTASDSSSSTMKKKHNWSHAILGDQPNDHFLLQIGYSDFLSKQDSVSTKGFGRSFNSYFMMAFADKDDNRFSLGVGLGVGTDNYYLNKEVVDLNNQSQLIFVSDTADTFKKSKFTAAYVEAPVEGRFSSNPGDPNSAWKFAIGFKLGYLLSLHTKEKLVRDQEGIPDYTIKQKNDRLFNPVRLAGTLRFGYGVVSLFTQVDITSFVKNGDGPSIRPYTIGFTLSGL
jgi:hypothetical protein